MIHLHVRDAEGQHCLDPEAYRATIASICEAVGDRLVLQITSESIGRYSPAEQRAAVLKTNPEAVSLALRELAPEAPDERDFCVFLGKLKQMRVWPQIILYTPSRGGAPGRDGETGADPLRQALRPLCARAVFAHPHRAAARPPAVPRARHAAVPCLERLRVRAPRDRLRHRRGAARGPRAGRLREQCQPCPTGRAPRRTRTWSAPPRARSKRLDLRPKPPTASGRRSRRRSGRDSSMARKGRLCPANPA